VQTALDIGAVVWPHLTFHILSSVAACDKVVCDEVELVYEARAWRSV
jgi:hypothetical protein